MNRMDHVEGDALLYIQPTKLVDEGPDYSPFEVWARYTSDGAAYRVFEDLSRDEARIALKLFSTRPQARVALIMAQTGELTKRMSR